MTEQDAAPAGGRRTLLPHPGGAGPRPAASKLPARSSLTVIGSAGRVGLMARQADEANGRQKTERRAKS